MSFEYPRIPFTSYVTSTGEITGTGNLPTMTMVNAQASIAQDRSVIALPSNPKTQFVVAGVIRDRFPLNVSVSSNTVVANGVDTVTLSNLPNPTKVRVYIVGVYDTEVVVTDGDLDLTFDVPGDYTVEMTANFTYLLQIEIINAT
jgi:hypothetical protein